MTPREAKDFTEKHSTSTSGRDPYLHDLRMSMPLQITPEINEKLGRIELPKRRKLLACFGAMAVAAEFSKVTWATDTSNAPKILLRSSWQTVNIGDIAHTPGVLALLEKHLPEAEVFLWPSSLADGVEELLTRRFPRMKLVRTKAEIATAMEQCHFLLHGSGPSLVAEKDVRAWLEQTGKPFGVYGITLPRIASTDTQEIPDEKFRQTVDLLSRAEFVYFRDSRSLALAKASGCTSPIMEFGPDGAFATDLANEKKAEQFLADHNLKPQEFVCCIPRLRYTPYWLIESKKRPFDPAKHARNEAMKGQDHAPLLEAVQQILTHTSYKVLLCPEDQTQMAVGKELIWDKLPSTLQPRVVHRKDYWLTDEAVSTYRLSLGLFGCEMHSPIMCVGNGIPAIVCRWAEQTTKGFMWQDIGLGDWLFDMDIEAEREKVAPAALRLVQERDWALQNVRTAKEFVETRQKATMQTLRNVLKMS